MLDSMTKILFSPFQREVAMPARKLIKTQKEFERFVSTNNGITDCYCDLYPYPFFGTIDKIYYDIDGVKKGMKQSLPYAKRFYASLLDRGLSVVPIVTGKKGYNLYPLLRPKQYENAKELLTKVAYSLIIDEFGSVSPTTINVDGIEHPTLVTVDDEGKQKEIICIDPKVIGDVRRFSRIPNTLRPPENMAWCTYLPPDEFLNMTIEDIHRHIKQPHTYEYKIKYPLPTLEDFQISDEVEKVIEKPIIVTNGPLTITNPNEFLKKILRPVLYRHILQKEPRHAVRVAVSIDLLEFFSVDEVFNIFSKLDWVDWDPEETRSQIISCLKYENYGNKKLRQLGIA